MSKQEQFGFGGRWTSRSWIRFKSTLRHIQSFSPSMIAPNISEQCTLMRSLARESSLWVLTTTNPRSLFAHDRELKGSALRALELSPPFDEYIFVEKNSSRCEELRNLSARFTSLS